MNQRSGRGEGVVWKVETKDACADYTTREKRYAVVAWLHLSRGRRLASAALEIVRLQLSVTNCTNDMLF